MSKDRKFIIISLFVCLLCIVGANYILHDALNLNGEVYGYSSVIQ